MFDLFAPWYERLFAPPPLDPLKRLLDLPTTGILLDVGGGTGRVVSQLLGMVGQVIVVDPSRGMLKQATKRHNLQVIQGVAERLPFAAEAFSRILVVDALHHFEDAHAAIHEMVRVLAPGGRLLIQEPDWRLPHIRLVAWGEKLLFMHSHPRPPQMITAMVRASGIQVHWIARDGVAWVIARKPPTKWSRCLTS